jgi:hypothetical protein
VIWTLIAALGCGTKGETAPEPTEPTEPEPSETEPPETTPEVPASWRYRLDAFRAYLEEEEGIDQDGDGTADNATPDALELVDALLVDVDASAEGLNRTVADAMATGTLILLAEATFEPELTVDLLTGAEIGRVPVPDAISYGDDGLPLARLVGAFGDDGAFTASADRVLVSIPFFPEEPALPFPIERATMVGTLEEEGFTGDLYGVIPADDLYTLLIVPLLEDAFPDAEERATYLELTAEVLENEELMDIDLGGGRRGVSCAFTLLASPSVWGG